MSFLGGPIMAVINGTHGADTLCATIAVGSYSFAAPGLHQVRVRANGAAGPLSRLDDTSLVVMR